LENHTEIEAGFGRLDIIPPVNNENMIGQPKTKCPERVYS
jgi:hypothetical protein